MTRYEIENELSHLYNLLEQVNMANEITACILCNTDTKQEAVESIQQSIDYYEGRIKEIEDAELFEDDGMDYDAICYSQGISRYC